MSPYTVAELETLRQEDRNLKKFIETNIDINYDRKQLNILCENLVFFFCFYFYFWAMLRNVLKKR